MRRILNPLIASLFVTALVIGCDGSKEAKVPSKTIEVKKDEGAKASGTGEGAGAKRDTATVD
ncbi:MAG: hypothetical protein N2039_01445 [Gemmataceae bacterium]|nr:hypothetical protein [Gemmataceae bacterium]